MREQYNPLWWDQEQSNNIRAGDNIIQQLLKGTYILETLQRYAKGLRYAFDEIVYPILLAAKAVQAFLPLEFHDEEEGKDKNEKENLWEAFRYTSSSVRSRSHEGAPPDDSEIIPIVDLINGLPSFCTEKINVEIFRGFADPKIWTSNIVACQDIAAGQELIISYGHTISQQ